MNRFFRILALNLLILLLLLSILEISFRVLDFGYGSSPLESDARLNHVHPRSYQFIAYDPSTEYGGHKVTYDSEGRRIGEGSSVKDSMEIWFFGDSFTEAVQLSWDSSYVGVVDRGTTRAVVNFGTTSYSPLLHYISLSDALSKGGKPSLVFVQSYSGDVSEDEYYAQFTTFDSLDHPVRCHGGSNSWFKRMLRRSFVIRVIKKSYLTLQYAVRNRGKSDESLVTGSYMEETRNIENTRFEKSILQIHRLLEDKGIPHFFFAIPSKYACLTGDWTKVTFADKFDQFMKKNGLPHNRLTEAFKRESTERSLFFKKDIHCNGNGNRVIGEELLKLVR